MTGPLVIGVGNPLRGDDGAGHRVIERVQERYPDLACLAVHQLTIDLAADVAESERVIFVDASVRVEAVTVGRIDPADRGIASHHVAPETVLSAAATLYGARPAAWLVEVPASALDHGYELSTITRAAIEQAVLEVGALLSAG